MTRCVVVLVGVQVQPLGFVCLPPPMYNPLVMSPLVAYYRALRQLSIDFKILSETYASTISKPPLQKKENNTNYGYFAYVAVEDLGSHSYVGEKVLITLWHTLLAFNFHLGYCFSFSFFFLFLICVQIIRWLFGIFCGLLMLLLPHSLHIQTFPASPSLGAAVFKVRIKSHLIIEQ